MFKGNVSPLNLQKDKYSQSNLIYQHTNNNDSHLIQNPVNSNYHPQTGYNYQNQPPANYQCPKSAYNNMINNKYQMNTLNYQAPLSPNINKNPLSPNTKNKMFSNTLNLNKKTPLPNNNPPSSGYQNIPDNNKFPPQYQVFSDNNTKQNKFFSKHGNKTQQQIFELTDSIDLKCDQVLEQTDIIKPINYPRSPLQTVNKKQNVYTKGQKSNIPILNLRQDIDDDDLKCDQVLDIKINDNNQSSRRNIKLIPNSNSHYPNNTTLNHQQKDLQNNFIYMNQMHTKNEYDMKIINDTKILNNMYSPINQKRKSNQIVPLIMHKKASQTLRQNESGQKNCSIKNISISKPHQQKLRSYSHVNSDNSTANGKNHNNNEQQKQNYEDLTNIESTAKNMQDLINSFKQRTAKLLQEYKMKLQQAQQRNKALQRQNLQLKKHMNQQSDNNMKGQNDIKAQNNQKSENNKNYSHFSHPLHSLVSGNSNIISNQNTAPGRNQGNLIK